MLSNDSNIYQYNPNIDITPVQQFQQPQHKNNQQQTENLQIQDIGYYKQPINNLEIPKNLNLQQLQEPQIILNKETFNNEQLKTTPIEKIKGIMFHNLLYFLLPLIIFVIIFVLFSLDFVRDEIFGILHFDLIDESDNSTALTYCIIYGLIIGFVYLVSIKIYKNIFVDTLKI